MTYPPTRIATTAVVFDLDDTLYPERSYALSGFHAAARWAEQELGLPALAPEMARLLDAGHLGKLFSMVLSAAKPDHTADELAAFIAAYRTHTPDIRLFEDGERMLAHYGRRGPLGLVTDGTHAMQRAKVEALAIAHHFRSIVYTDALGPDRAYFKPHRKAFEQVAAALGSDRLVYIGDNAAKDFVAPNALGWTTVQVVRPGSIHASDRVAPGGEPHYRIGSLFELPDVLGF